jgi:hypothetical protein
MSKLKNTFGLPDSLIDIVNQVNETSHLSPKQKKIAKMAGDPNKIDAEDLQKLRMKNESEQFSKDMTNLNKAEAERLKSEAELRSVKKATAPKQPLVKMGEEIINEIGDTPKGQKNLIDLIKVRQMMGKKSEDDKVQKQAAKRLEKHAEVINNSFKENDADELNEYNFKAGQTGTYPFKANEVAPLIGTLRMLLNFLASSPALKKLMKEETGIDTDNVDSLINFFEVLGEELELIEYRTKGAVGKKKAAAATSSSVSKPENKESDDEEEDEGPAYEPASGKDQEHIMTQLKGAIDTGGRHIDTSSGKKFVSKSTAEKIHSHLMGLKAPERAQSSSELYNLKATHPMTKHIQDDDREAAQRGIKAPTDKKGRGRPKKVVS